MDTKVKSASGWNGWKALVRPVLSYAIAIGLIATGPMLLAAGLGLSLLTGDATILAVGLLAGAAIGLVGALALMWCLAGSRVQAAGKG